MFFCSFVLICVTSSMSFTGFYTEDEPRKNGRHKPFLTGIDWGRNRCFSRQYYPRENHGVFYKPITLHVYSDLLDIKDV